MKKLAIVLGFLLAVGFAHAQTCATRPSGDSSNACASTAFVQAAIGGGGALPAPVDNAVFSWSNTGVPQASTTLPSGLTIPSPTLSGTVSLPSIPILKGDTVYIQPSSNTTGVLWVFDDNLNTGTAAAGFGLDANVKNSSGVDETMAFINPGCKVCGPTGSEVGDIDFGVYSGFANAQQIIAESAQTSSADPTLGPSTDNLWNLGLSGFRWKAVYAVQSVIGSIQMISSATFPTADGTTALQFKNATLAHSLIDLDTNNYRVGIGEDMISPAHTLDISGDLGVSSSATIGGAINAAGLPTSGTAHGSLCIDSSGNVFVKTTTGACL